MKYEIKNRFTGKVQFAADINADEYTPTSLKIGLSLQWAIKHNANLIYANLIYADLRGANLRCVTGNMQELKSAQLDEYVITYTSNTIQIGCERHTIDEWKNFDDERIAQMDGKRALKFWREWRDWLFELIEKSPAIPTGEV